MQKQFEKWLFWGSALTFWLLLSAYVLLLPPYEGFDERAHYSYISYLADSHRIPILGKAHLDKTVENDRSGLPKPYTSVPPYDQNYGFTYKSFFDLLSSAEREKNLQRYWSKPDTRVRFTPDHDKKQVDQRLPSIYSLNWEAQHPPIFYALMTIPYHLASGLSAGMRLVALRFVSVLFAGLSAVFWLKSINLVPNVSRHFAILGGLIILFFPSLFFDLARLGNDGLAAFIFSGVFYFATACIYQDSNKRFRNFIYLSVMLSLGLLTKLFFLPITVGIFVFYIWLGRRNSTTWRELLTHLGASLVIILLISGWWYILCFYRYGVIFVSEEMMHFRNVSDPLGLHLSLASFLFQSLKVFDGFITSFLWSGTQSWIPRFPQINLLWGPLFVMFLAGAFQYFRYSRKEARFWLFNVSVIAPLLLGFGYHMYVRVKFTGVGSGTGGYYLFVVWPVIGCLSALCFENIISSARKYCLFFAFGCLLIFEISGWWLLLQIYSGVVGKAGNVSLGKGVIMLTPANLLFVLERLKGFVFPYAATVLYAVAFAIKGFLMWLAVFRYRNPVYTRSSDI